MSHPRCPSFNRSRHDGAFTLVEMLIAVALVVVLMLAVTQIFSIAGKTVGGGQALGAMVRDAQAAQTVLNRDLSAAAVTDGAMVIRMQRIAAWRNRSDLFGDLDQDPMTYDGDGDGVEEVDLAGNTAPNQYRSLLYNFRNHRVDAMTFFARDRFVRQTGNDGTLVANMTSNEAAISIHHLTLPHTSGSFFLDGAANAGAAPNGDPTPANKLLTPGNYKTGTTDQPSKLDSNPQNLLASQWLLGRVAMLLVEPTGGVINDKNGVSQVYIQRSANSSDTVDTNDDLTPFQLNSSASAGTKKVQDARFDLAGTSIDAISTQIRNILTANAGADWWTPLTMNNTRFAVNPFVTRPITAQAASQQVPAFVPACSQFIVEFAGDFVTQDWNPDGTGDPDETTDLANTNYGRVLGTGPDGRIDTVYNPALPAAERYTGQVRWYGLPRDSNGDGIIRANEGDVVPVRDVAGVAQAFERTFPSGAAIPMTDNYYTTTSSSIAVNPEYLVAWSPNDTNRPKMIRITLGIDRPEADGRLNDAQLFEYVFKVGQ